MPARAGRPNAPSVWQDHRPWLWAINQAPTEVKWPLIASSQAVQQARMTAEVRVEFTVPAEVREEGACFVAGCPPLDIFSQGETEEAALANLAEALRLFVESCCERGMLEEALKGGESLADPVTSPLAKAPMDDEPVTPADVEAIKEGERDIEEGRIVSAAELRRRLDAADALSGLQREAEQRGLDRLTLNEVHDEIQATRRAPIR